MWITAEQSTKVTLELLRMYGISIGELFETAIKNSKFIIKPMWEVMLSLMPEGFADNEELLATMQADDNGLYLITSPDMQEGAGALLKTDVFRKFAEKENADLYILPSSIHEVLILKADGEKNDAELRQMVTSVNQTEVDPTDKLSDNVYFYDRKTDRITIC